MSRDDGARRGHRISRRAVLTRERMASWGRWLYAITLVVAVLALGTIHTTTLMVVSGMALVSAALVYWGGPRVHLRTPAAGVTAIGLGLTLYTLVQALPLPIAWILHLSPHAADVWSRCLAPLREPGPLWATLSLDPSETRIQVLRGALYLLVFLAGVRIAHQREGSVFIERVLLASGVIFAAAVLLHPAFSAERVFGAYEPVSKHAFEPRHIAPLLNSNHQGAYLNVAFAVALGTMLSTQPVVPRLVAGSIVAVLLGTQLWISSRGGTISMVVAAGVIVALAARARKLGHEGWGTLLPIALLALGGVTMAVLSSHTVRNELGSTDVSKLSLARAAFGLVRLYPVFGLGRGAFESTFPEIRVAGDHTVDTHPENLIAEWMTEWGPFVAVPALVGLLYALRPQVALVRTLPAVGPWGALAALFVQNLVDYSSEVPGVVIAAAACAALVTAGPTGTSRASMPLLSRSRVAVTCAGVLAAIGLPLAATSLDLDLSAEQRRLHAQLLEPTVSLTGAHDLLRATMLRHPAEPYFPFLGALRATVRRDEDMLPWANRTLERSRIHGRTHLLLARWLYRRGPSQARLEYRLAYEQDQWLRPFVSAELPALVGSFDDASETVPKGVLGLTMIESLVPAIEERLPATAYRLDGLALLQNPEQVGSRSRRAALVVRDATAIEPEPWCEGDARAHCLDVALEQATAFRDLRPRVCDGYRLVAQVFAAKGDTKSAFAEMDRAVDAVDDRVTCLRATLDLARVVRDDLRMDRAIDRLTHAGCTSDKECVDHWLFAAHVEEERKNPRRAHVLYKRAAELDPNRDDLIVRSAESASRVGLHGEAVDLYKRLSLKYPGEPRWQAAVVDETHKAQRVGLPTSAPDPFERPQAIDPALHPKPRR